MQGVDSVTKKWAFLRVALGLAFGRGHTAGSLGLGRKGHEDVAMCGSE